MKAFIIEHFATFFTTGFAIVTGESPIVSSYAQTTENWTSAVNLLVQAQGVNTGDVVIRGIILEYMN
jgi:hypothetical protein